MKALFFEAATRAPIFVAMPNMMHTMFAEREVGVRTERPMEKYWRVRQQTERLAAPLEPEDCVVQTSTECSPTKWHLAHTTWFFETFILKEFDREYAEFNPLFGYLFNSYYNSIGERTPRDQRGLMSRPTLAEVLEYRNYVDRAIELFIQRESDDTILSIFDLGLNHEQQHQELILTDIKTVLAINPLHPAYCNSVQPLQRSREMGWLGFDEQIAEIGASNSKAFYFDNEGPKHRVYLDSFRIADRLVTNAEYKAFIADGGYGNPLLWLSDGWALAQRESWLAPKYWEQRDGTWWHYTLSGYREVNDDEPVNHISLYEADAFATWSGFRLPTEFEWEFASKNFDMEGSFLEGGNFHPNASIGDQFFGEVWQWTRSAYLPYPGFTVSVGALGEYNGKFMSNQMVLRGGSCATPRDHVRNTYRNFFPPESRWQFSGIRLAK